LLQEFTEVGKSDSEELNEINQEDEINDKTHIDPLVPNVAKIRKKM
jgi:hypothetical protein